MLQLIRKNILKLLWMFFLMMLLASLVDAKERVVNPTIEISQTEVATKSAVTSATSMDTKGEYTCFVSQTDETLKEIVSSSATSAGVTQMYPSLKPRRIRPFEHLRRETFLFAQIIECEVGGQSKKDKIATGSVVLNRTRTKFGSWKNTNTIKEVLYQHYGTSAQQYGQATIDKIEAGIRPSEESVKVAKGLINGTIKCLDESILYQTGSRPTWNVIPVNLPGTSEYYSKPAGFEEYRKSKEN